MIDQRTMDKYEKEAKEQSRESWYLSWALDTNKEERAKVLIFFFLTIKLCNNISLNFNNIQFYREKQLNVVVLILKQISADTLF